MTLTRYDLTDPDSVNAYLDRVNGEHNPAFEMWRTRRIARGFPTFVVEHPGAPEYVELGGRWHRVAPKEDA
jgi:hypothetical protein